MDFLIKILGFFFFLYMVNSLVEIVMWSIVLIYPPIYLVLVSIGIILNILERSRANSGS